MALWLVRWALPCSCTAFFPVLHGITDVTASLGDVSGTNVTFSLGPRDSKRVDRDENKGLGTRQRCA